MAVAALLSVADDAAAVLQKLVTGTLQTRASDLHLRAGASPFLRIDGKLTRVPGTALTPRLVEQLLVLTSGRDIGELTSDSFEFSFEETGVARFRGHAFRESGHWALTLRVLPVEVPSFVELRLPPVVKQLCEVQPGLVLITGPTGSGKSSTAASMLRYMASSDTLHVVTVEDPVEYRLTDTGSCVSQRELGRDTASYAEALHSAFREDPDVLFVGEIRDAATLEVALQAAETGSCVLSTFHTATALKTVQRMLSLVPSDDSQNVRNRLADSLRAVISQRLLPKKGGRGRVLCCEVMVSNFTVKECIRDAGRTPALSTTIERGQDQSMISFDRHLVALVRDGQVSAEVALAYAVAPNDLKRLLNLPGLT